MMYLTPLFLPNLGFQVAALSVISPNQGDRLDFSQANTVKWSSEHSDPKYVDISLSNNDRALRISSNIAKNVSSSEESYTFTDVTALPGSGYVLSFKDAANGNIEAQSDEFSVVTKGNANVTSSENGSTGRNSTSQYKAKNSPGQISVFSSAGACLFSWIIAFGWLWGVLFT